jgi:hypothetical protein
LLVLGAIAINIAIEDQTDGLIMQVYVLIPEASVTPSLRCMNEIL